MPEGAPIGAAADGSTIGELAVVLIGMMGAGKTTVGQVLSDRLACRYYDNDTEVEKRAGTTVAEMFRTQGEPAFREQEARAVIDAMSMDRPIVVSVGGGAVLRPETQELLRQQATVVWLRAPVEVLIDRVRERDEDRPLITGDPAANMRRLYEQRHDLYASLADITVDVHEATPEEIAEEITSGLMVPGSNEEAG